jgi:ketosteroid isomerase-like protein
LEWGRCDPERWGRGWRELFDSHELIRNERKTRKIEVSREADGAFAVVDIDTVWHGPDGNESRWKGRVCKVYSKAGGEWKMTMHSGVLECP